MSVFLSYRRDDSGPRAGRLRDALAARFGDDNIFQDVVAIAPGDRFDDAIDSALRQGDASIAVIGPGWISAVDAHGQARLTNTDDCAPRTGQGTVEGYADDPGSRRWCADADRRATPSGVAPTCTPPGDRSSRQNMAQ